MSSVEQTIETQLPSIKPEADGPVAASAGELAPQLSRKRLLLALSWIAPVLLLVTWEWLAQIGWLSPQVLPAPSKVVRTAFKLAVSGTLLNDLGVSMLRAAIGFAIGGGIGFALGTLVGFSRIAEALVDRSVQMIRAIPFLALLPLVIVWFGVGEGQKIFLVSLGVAFPIYINTTLGIRQVDPKLLGARPRAGPQHLATHPPHHPARRPAIDSYRHPLFARNRVACAGGRRNHWRPVRVGFLAMDAREFLRTDVIVLTIVIYALIGVAADSIAKLLERRLLAWHPNYGSAR